MALEVNSLPLSVLMIGGKPRSAHTRQRRHYIVTPQVLPNVDGQTLPSVIVDQGVS